MFNSASYLINLSTLIDVGDYKSDYAGVSKVLLTHCHLDHIYGLNDLYDNTGGFIVHTNEFGREMLLDSRKNLSYYHERPFVFNHPELIHTVSDGEEISLADGLTARAIFTPGHNPSCITWQIEDALFTGDAFIPGLRTVTNLPCGNKAQARASEERIISLSATHAIYPGHIVKT